jgi:hypothetical protein
MPTWPSANKAVTTYTDQGTDRLADARPEINKTIANVNDIIDTFAIATPSDGDLLQYSTGTGKWEQVASTTVGSQVSIATAYVGSALYPSTAGTLDRYPNWQEDDDPDSIMSISNGVFTLAGSGTFLVLTGPIQITDTGSGVFFRNETTSTNIYQIQLQSDTTPKIILPHPYVVTQASSTSYSIKITNTGSTALSNAQTKILYIQKLA